MSSPAYKLENFLDYHGSVEEVQKMIDRCPYCGSELLLTHVPDYKNLIIHESAKCLDCGNSNRKIIHIIN
jgi:DNA-directed RNA polymerase subunit RPC12/RpoP